ncbi:MAG: sigma-54 dependent transcriptional regulator, partial [Myxococcota bacterium]
MRILLIDDDEEVRHMTTLHLKKDGHRVRSVDNGEEGLKELLADPDWDLVLCDVRMPIMGGMELLDELRERRVSATVIVMSAFGSRELAIDALKRGAYDYISKPFKRDELLLTLAKASERLALKRENEELREAALARDSFQGIIGKSGGMQDVFRTVERVAPFTSTVLITGESGTGKELIARAIHDLSNRSEGPWIAVNCGAIPVNLLESELFGHVKGAFTDASGDKEGLFEAANGGTLFLDEIAEMPVPLQVKLLRVLESREVRRVGGTGSLPIDVRIVAATLQELEGRVEEGSFRADLLHRINVIPVHLPPLRHRREDVPILVRHFIDEQNRTQGTKIEGVTDEAMELMLEYGWPGNVRELRNCIERGAVMSMGSAIGVDVLPAAILEAKDEMRQLLQTDELSIKKLTSQLESILIRRA